MNHSRDTILKELADRLARYPLAGTLPQPPPYRSPVTATLDDFIREAEQLSAQVIRAHTPDKAAQALTDLCTERGWKEVLAWEWDQIGCPEIEAALHEMKIGIRHSGTKEELAHIPAGITGVTAAIAETGTLVLRSGAGRSPLVSLLPETHIAILKPDRIYADITRFIAGIKDIDAGSNLVFISGPSRTADIEQTLTLGVHGPRELIIVITELM